MSKPYLLYVPQQSNAAVMSDVSVYQDDFQCVNSIPEQIDTYLVLDHQGLKAVIPSLKKPFQLNFDQGKIQYRSKQGHELLYRATLAHRKIEQKPLHIIDATAGLAREAFLLAMSGAYVDAIESNINIFHLTANALQRSQACQSLQLNFIHMDANDYIAQYQADVIYLDPMFPKSKKSAAVGKEAQVLQAFVSSPSTQQNEMLLQCAIDHARYRVVVKRPLRAQPLANRIPSSSIKGKAIRYDIYGKRKIPKS